MLRRLVSAASVHCWLCAAVLSCLTAALKEAPAAVTLCTWRSKTLRSASHALQTVGRAHPQAQNGKQVLGSIITMHGQYAHITDV